VHAVRTLVHAGIGVVVVAAPPGQVDEVRRLLRPVTGDQPCTVVAGGESRRESVAAGLEALGADIDLVLVHDAARPLAPEAVARRVLGALATGASAVVPAVPLSDTVKQVANDQVVRTLDRAELRAAQTPQGFRRDVLLRAHQQWRDGEPTDDAAMVEALGVPVQLVAGAAEAFKITGALDLRLAEALLERWAVSESGPQARSRSRQGPHPDR